MKKPRYLLLLCLIVAIFGNAQEFTIGMESGFSFGHTVTVGTNIGINFKNFSIRTGFDTHLSNLVSDGILIQTKIGYTFNLSERIYINPAIGHGYIYKSQDNKGLNSSQTLYGAELGYKYEFKEQPMAAYLGLTKAGEFVIIGIGIRGFWN